jgi:hypothetical protein
MRFHEGNFAYDIEHLRDPATQLPLTWRFTIYRLLPFEMVVARGEGKTREEAEQRARKAISKAVPGSKRAA